PPRNPPRSAAARPRQIRHEFRPPLAREYLPASPIQECFRIHLRPWPSPHGAREVLEAVRWRAWSPARSTLRAARAANQIPAAVNFPRRDARDRAAPTTYP